MKRPEIIGWELTRNENDVEMATLPAKVLRDALSYIEFIEAKSVNENEIKRAFAMEVIEKINRTYLRQNVIDEFIKIVQSLLPKEEEVDWSKASGSDKIKYAHYYSPIGTKFINAHYYSPSTATVPEKRVYNNFEEGLGLEGYGWLLHCGKWAEIVEPETKTEESVDYLIHGYNFNPEILKINTNTESDEGKEDSEAFVDECKQVRRYFVDFLRENYLAQAHLKLRTQTDNILIMFDQCLERICPEPTLEQKARKKAEEIMNKKRKHDFTGVEYFTLGATELMLIEALLIDPKTL